MEVIRPWFDLSRSDHWRMRGGARCHAPPLWPCNMVLKPNFQSIISQTNNGCSLLSFILSKLLLLDISWENIFALSIVTALTAHPFSIKKYARMSVFLCENRKNLLARDCKTPPLCLILSAPLESDCHMSEHFVFV